MGFRVSELFVFVLTRVLVLCIKENIKQWVECVNRIYIECIETIRLFTITPSDLISQCTCSIFFYKYFLCLEVFNLMNQNS